MIRACNTIGKLAPVPGFLGIVGEKYFAKTRRLRSLLTILRSSVHDPVWQQLTRVACWLQKSSDHVKTVQFNAREASHNLAHEVYRYGLRLKSLRMSFTLTKQNQGHHQICLLVHTICHLSPQHMFRRIHSIEGTLGRIQAELYCCTCKS